MDPGKIKYFYRRNLRFHNGGQNTDFHLQIKSLDQNLKTTFPKECFNEIVVKVGEHDYIYIVKIRFEKKIFRLKMPAKHFCHMAKKC